MNFAMDSKTRLVIYCVLLSWVIFFLDLYIPLGVATGVLYITVILISLRLNSRTSTVVLGILVSLLTLMGYFFSAELGIEWMVLANRALSLFVIWVTVLLGLKVKEAQSKMDESVERFQMLTEQSSIMMWQADITGAWIFVSSAWIKFTGTQVSRELNKGWLHNIHPDERAMVLSAYHKLVEEAHPMQLTCRLRNHSSSYRWITFQGNACYSAQGVITGFLGTVIDINDSKETELLLAEARQKYYQQEKMASLGSLASGILHEIGNPLAGILGLLVEIEEALKSEQLSDGNKTQVASYFSMIFDELNRLTRIAQDVSHFSHTSPTSDDLVNLNELTQRTCRLVLHDERMWKMKLTVDLDKNIPAIKLVNDHFIQVLQNLINNAIDACAQDTEKALIEVRSGVNNQQVHISVTDNGTGMSPEVLARVGQEFYTTKLTGTGLGLSICYSLIEKMNGKLDINSVEGEGCEVVMSFPIDAN